MTTLTNDKNQVKTSLHQVADDLIKTYQPIATRNKTSFINNIPAKLVIDDNVYQVVSVLNGMLEDMANNATESNLYIFAKEVYGEMVEVYIKDENCFNAYALALGLQNVVRLAQKAGGQLYITNQRKKITTITFR